MYTKLNRYKLYLHTVLICVYNFDAFIIDCLDSVIK